MSDLEQRFADYRALRDASKKVLLEEIEHARTAYSAKGLTNRYLGGVIEGGKDVYEVAKVHTVDNRGIIAIVLGALALWFGREPLLAAMAEEIDNDRDDPDFAHPSPEMSEAPLSPGDENDR